MLKYKETIGWIAMAILLAAFTLNSLDFIKQTLLYYSLNTVGAAVMSYYCFSKKTFPPAILNAVWLVVAFIKLVQTLAYG